jgi:hypothetical protein
VLYDRGVSRASGFKRFSLNLPVAPSVDTNARRATEALPSGQKLFIQTLLPLTATLTITPVGGYTDVAEFDPITSRYIVEDPSLPRDARFLHVLQGADAGSAPLASTLVHSISGTPFAGVVVSNTAVMFPVIMGPGPTSTVSGAPFTGTTYLAPGDTNLQLITGLSPNAGYNIFTQTIGLNTRITILPGGTAVYADSGGVIGLGMPVQAFWRTYVPVINR